MCEQSGCSNQSDEQQLPSRTTASLHVVRCCTAALLLPVLLQQRCCRYEYLVSGSLVVQQLGKRVCRARPNLNGSPISARTSPLHPPVPHPVYFCRTGTVQHSAPLGERHVLPYVVGRRWNQCIWHLMRFNVLKYRGNAVNISIHTHQNPLRSPDRHQATSTVTHSIASAAASTARRGSGCSSSNTTCNDGCGIRCESSSPG